MILLRMIGLLLDLLLLPLRLVRRGRSVPEGAWLSLTIDGPVAEVVVEPRFWQLRAQKVLSLQWLDEVVTAMIGDPRVKGLLVTVRSMQVGMASASSLRAILARARAGGKEVVVHLPRGGDTKEVYVAVAASKVFLGPAAQMAPLGFRSTAHYMKRVLEHGGLEPQVFACGEYKSAGETLVRDAMSPEQRAQLERLIDAFYEALVDGIATGRGVSPERARAIVDEAPYFGRAAIEAGLADDVAYDDEISEKLSLSSSRKLVDAGAYLVRRKRPLLRRVVPRPVVAVVRVHGTIAHGPGPLGRVSTDERVIRTVRAVRRSNRVRGVILHVDSPGGSALASDLMHHEIAQLARDKPVVACMANVAASGGYYVAAPAACIVAEPTTLTGSIGVVAARLSLAPLLQRLGVTTETVEKGERAQLLSSFGPLDADARGAVMRELDATYRQFLRVVAEGREMTEAEVERLARGRVYTGQDALAAGLVDALGGFSVAVAEVKKLLDARVRDRVEIVVARTPRSPLPPQERRPTRSDALALLATLLPDRERRLIELADAGERVFALAPVTET
jgi:protease-4